MWTSGRRPAAFLLENVKQLRGHDKGRTLETILEILRGDHEQSIPNDIPMSEESRATISEKLNYWVDFKVLRARDFGVPQNRERILIIGFNRDLFPAGTNFENEFEWPEETRIKTCVGDIMETSSDPTSVRRGRHAHSGAGRWACLFLGPGCTSRITSTH